MRKSSFPGGVGGPTWQMPFWKGLSERRHRLFVSKGLSVWEGEQMNSTAFSSKESLYLLTTEA